MTEETTPPIDIDVTTPSTARMYDYYLGGKDHYAADREAAQRVFESVPETPKLARQNRGFLQRAVRYLAAEAGIRQFIDVGTGLPTQGNVHEIAQQAAPDTQVVYVDNDPVVLAHARALLAHHNDNVAVVEGDLRLPGAILNHLDMTRLIDFTEPVAVLFASVLHFATDEDNPARIVAAFRDRMAPGSYVVISHVTPGNRPDDAQQGAQVYQQATSTVTLRTRDQVASLFDGFTLVDPGVTTAADWRSDSPPSTDPVVAQVYAAGVARLD